MTCVIAFLSDKASATLLLPQGYLARCRISLNRKGKILDFELDSNELWKKTPILYNKAI